MQMFSRRAVLALTAAAALSVPLQAQRAPITRVLITTVKPDRTTDFEAAVKQFNEVYAKIPGARSRVTFQSLTGPRRYVLVRDYDKWEDLDSGPVDKAVWRTRSSRSSTSISAPASRAASC